MSTICSQRFAILRLAVFRCLTHSTVPDALRKDALHPKWINFLLRIAIILILKLSLQVVSYAQTKPETSFDSLNRSTQLPDSIPPGVSEYNRKLDSVQSNLTHRIDSLKRLNLPTTYYTLLLDSLQKAGPAKDIKNAEARLASLQQQVNRPAGQLQSDVSAASQKLGAIEKNIGTSTGLPGNVSIPKLQMPGLNLSVPGTVLPGSNASLPLNNLNQSNLSGAGSQINGLSNGLQSESGQLKNDVPVGEIRNDLGQANAYSKDLKNISKGNIDSVTVLNKTLENKAAAMAHMGAFQSGTAELNQYKTLAGQANDPGSQEKLAVQQVQRFAIDHFAGKEQMLQAAMNKMSKYKRRYPELSSVSDITKRVRNQMHGKPFIDRIIPGFAFQYQYRREVLVDFNPTLGYRISGPWTAGLGWVERIQFHHFYNTVPQGRIYGLRAFNDIKLKSGFYLRGEIERINSEVPFPGTLTENSRQWLWGGFAGVKKDYRFFGGVMGNVQTLYYFTRQSSNASPYASKFNVRFGFEFPFRKKLSSPSLSGLPLPFGSINNLTAQTILDPIGLAKLKQLRLTTTNLGREKFAMTRGIMSHWRKHREVYSPNGHYRFKYNRQTHRDEIRDEKDSLLATVKDYDVTMPDGRIYDFVRVSPLEWKYLSSGKEIVIAKLGIGGNQQIALSWLGEPTDARDLLEMMCKLHGCLRLKGAGQGAPINGLIPDGASDTPGRP